MKNKEKYLDEIAQSFIDIDAICGFKRKHILKTENCWSINCPDCREKVKKWLEQEYQEPIQLTDDEKAILKNLPKNIKWIARDQNERLYLYYKKPQKELTCWNSDWVEYDFAPYDHLFKFIKWEDEKAWEIDELLKQNGVERNEE